MAKYTVTHACGHTAEHQLFGKESDRQSRLAWLRTTDCRDCYKAGQAAELSAKVAEIGVDLPALSGSPKQVAWATTLRDKRLAALSTRPIPEERRAGFFGALAAKTDSRWWIDNRDLSDRDIGMMIAREMQQ